MNNRQMLILILGDLLVFSLLLFLFTYLGMVHLFLALLGGIIFLLGVYDLLTGHLSAILSLVLGFPGEFSGSYRKKNILNYLPLVVSVFFLAYSVPMIWQKGWIIEQHREMMQEAYFSFLTLGVIVLAAVISVLCMVFYLWQLKEKKK